MCTSMERTSAGLSKGMRIQDFIKIAKLGVNLHLVLLSLVDDQTYDILCKVQISDRISTDMGVIGKLYKEVMGGGGGSGGCQYMERQTFGYKTT